MRCKVVCNFKQDYGDGVNLSFGPVYNGSPENQAFFKATPGGTISFYTVNKAAADRFEHGKEYYVDFSPAQ
jgi:hypothetical protein